MAGAMEALCELSLDLFAVVDLDGRFRWLNPAWERTLGYRAEDLLSKPFLDLVHPDDVEETLAVASLVASEGSEQPRFRNRYRKADGSYCWLEWVSKTSGELIYATAREVTRQVEAEQLRASYELMLEQQVRERTRELEESRREILRRLALAAEYRDDATHEHAERVGWLAAALARELGCVEDFVERIRQAAPLHDLGKLAISDTILLKPGRLDPPERQQVETHAAAGAAILSGSRFDVLQLAQEIALTHHEWWDGSGYPNGLRREAIPVSGRVVALADVFDALTHDRPYKHAWPLERALAKIRSLSGHQFDPRVVEAFDRLYTHAPLQAVG